jgi:hypothetical protein
VGGRTVVKTNARRIILDAAMALLLILMYHKLAISLSFHEIGGLVVCGMFIFHNVLNRKWIVGISKRMFGRRLAPRVRLGYVLNVVLLITMAFIALSGIMISQTILWRVSGDIAFWRPWHYFAAAVALVLVGIHIGLHWSFIRTSFGRVLRLPKAVARPLGIACLTAVVAFGVYSMATTHFLQWLGEPLGVASEEGSPDAADKGQGGQGRGLQQGAGGSGEIDHPLLVIATYGSIVAVPAALAAATEAALKRRKRQPQRTIQPAEAATAA